MLIKEDAKTIADAKKNAYVKEKTLEFIPECFIKIREAANDMKYETTFHVGNVQFILDIVLELSTVLEKSGYTIKVLGARRNSKMIHIYWRELNDIEKKYPD